MSTKKLLIIIGGLVAGLMLMVVLVVGLVAGVIFYSIGSSEAARAGREFLRSNERLKRETGEVRDFGSVVTGSIKANEAGGGAALNFKVIGVRRTLNASVTLIYKTGYGWRAVGGSYKDDAGRTIELLKSYGTDETAGDDSPVNDNVGGGVREEQEEGKSGGEPSSDERGGGRQQPLREEKR